MKSPDDAAESNRLNDENRPPNPTQFCNNNFNWKQFAKRLIGTVVAAFVLWTAWKGYQDLIAQGNVRWQDFGWHWLALSIILYFVGMVPSWLYWHWILGRFGFRTKLSDSFRAFYLSQLGKYVPGKVMVVLIRTAILCHRPLPYHPIANDAAQQDTIKDHQWVIVSATALMETLTFISVGGMIGAIAGTYYFSDKVWILALAVAIALLLPTPILPPVFRFWIKRLPFPRNSEAKDLLCSHWSWESLGVGVLLLPFGWLTLGLCLWTIFFALPEADVSLADYPSALTCVSLANVLGFVSLIPGGFGVREIVMYPILENRFSLAIVIVILYRLSSLAAELAVAGIAWLLTFSTDPGDSPTT